MSENNETHEKIVAEVRDLSKCVKHKVELGEYICVPLPTVEGKPLDVYFAELADRLEAATQREREATGNSAALRKALGELRAELWNNTVISGKRKFKLYEIADAALAKPARNCDVYDNPYDAADAWPDQEMCAGRRYQKGTCDGCKYSPARCVAKWLYDVAKKKRGDESPRTEQEGEV